jgi:hypothetical protein
VHAALTGERQGTLEDFGGVQPIAEALRDRFVNDGRYSHYRQRRYGRPAGHLPSDRFVVCVQNHDQIGNRAGGERLSLEPDRWVRLLLSAPRSLVGAAFNFSSGVTPVPLSSACDLFLSTDDHKYGGSGGLRIDENGVSLPPLSAAVFRAGTELR